MTRSLVLALVLLWSMAAAADGGTLRIRQEAGSLQVSAFTRPDTLTVGSAEIELLIQPRPGSGAAVGTELRLRDPSGIEHDVAVLDRAADELFSRAHVVFSTPGNWTLTVTVASGADRVEASALMPVERARSYFRVHWLVLLAPLLLVGWFALMRVARRVSRANPSRV